MNKLTAHLTVPTDGGPIPAIELQEVLNEFISLYQDSVDDFVMYLGIDDGTFSQENIDTLMSRYYPIPESENVDLLPLFRDYNTSSLDIIDIRRDNPIEIVVMGLAGPLALAVILSGGELRLGSALRVKLPPIGHGIQQLRLALRSAPVQAVKARKAKLATEKNEAANKQEPTKVAPQRTKPLKS